MTRATNAVASRRRKKRVLKAAKGFYGDRKNHYAQAKSSVKRAMAFNYRHRKHNKRNFRRLWITRIGAAAKINGISYSKLIDGLTKVGCQLNRKMLAHMAATDPEGFTAVTGLAKGAFV